MRVYIAEIRGEVCISMEVNAVKRYRRIWNPGTDREVTDWSWNLHSTAKEMKPE